jgi:protein-tyrosine phosphatase
MIAPIRDSYWVIDGRLLAGEYPGAITDEEARSKLGAILDAGVRSFLDLTEAHELRPYAPLLIELAEPRGIDVQYRRMSVVDLGVPSIGHMRAILRHIDDEIGAGRPVYVHCWGGIGRTGTVVGCWMIEHEHCGAAQVIERIADLRRLTGDRALASPQMPEQVDFVVAWVRSKVDRRV